MQTTGRRRAFRATVAAVAVSAMTLGLAEPAEATFQPSITHIWGHIKALADSRYASKGSFKTLRGPYALIKENAAAAGELVIASIVFSPALPAAPTKHIINPGDTAPAECPGTVAAPQAAPGHFCVYVAGNWGTSGPSVQDPAQGPGTVGVYGTNIYVNSSAAGYVESRGTWAVTRP